MTRKARRQNYGNIAQLSDIWNCQHNTFLHIYDNVLMCFILGFLGFFLLTGEVKLMLEFDIMPRGDDSDCDETSSDSKEEVSPLILPL